MLIFAYEDFLKLIHYEEIEVTNIFTIYYILYYILYFKNYS